MDPKNIGDMFIQSLIEFCESRAIYDGSGSHRAEANGKGGGRLGDRVMWKVNGLGSDLGCFCATYKNMYVEIYMNDI